MRTIKIDLTTYRHLLDEGDHIGINYQAISTMVLIRYRSGVVHNYSIKKLSSLCKCSRKTVRDALSWGFSRGLCRVEGRHIFIGRFVYIPSQKRRKGHRFTPAEVLSMTTLREVKDIFRISLFIDKLHNMSHKSHRTEMRRIKMSRESSKLSPPDNKGKGSSADSSDWADSVVADILIGGEARSSGDGFDSDCLTYKGISKAIGMSVSSGQRYAKKAMRLKVVRRKRRLGFKRITSDLIRSNPFIGDKLTAYNLWINNYVVGDFSGIFHYRGRLYYQSANRWALPYTN